MIIFQSKAIMTEINHILIVHSDPVIRTTIGPWLAEQGYQVSQTSDGDEGLGLLPRHGFQAVIAELDQGDRSWPVIMGHIRENTPATPVFFLVSTGAVDRTAEAMRQGAYDVKRWPVEREHLLHIIDQSLKGAKLNLAYDYLRHEQPYIYRYDKIIASSPVMNKVMTQVERVAGTDYTVMLTGESGVGKSLIAGLIHHNSPRRDHTLVTVNCAALTETLLESELFGHEKGAFTGAHKARAGRIQQAHGGTLFLDEIGDMAINTQAKVLRAIEDRVIRRVGGSREIRVDVRIISATNRNLEHAVAEGDFREDLFYRLHVAAIRIPSLRERPEDIGLLADKFVRRVCEELKRPQAELTDQARRALLNHHWPGNIRELKNVIERAVLFSEGDVVSAEALDLRDVKAGQPDPVRPADQADAPPDLNLENMERWAIETALERTEYIQARAAEMLGISPRSLLYRIDKLGISHPTLDARRRKA